MDIPRKHIGNESDIELIESGTSGRVGWSMSRREALAATLWISFKEHFAGAKP